MSGFRVLAVRVLALLAGVLFCAWAQAQAYPSKLVRVIVPFSAGGGIDALARAVSNSLTQDLGQQVVVENKAGGTGVIGIEYVARSAADGHTLLFSDPTLVLNSLLLSKVPYDPVKDFAPVVQVASLPFVLVVPATMAVRDVRELIEMARAKPGTLNFASWGIGSSGHLMMEMFQSMAGVRMNHVPYKGSAPALADIAGGRVETMVASIGAAIPQWKAGKVRLLAMGGLNRYAPYPDIPTANESGLPGYEATSWFGLFAPAGSPRDALARVSAAVVRITADPGFKAKHLDPGGFEAVASSPERFADHLKTDAARWAKLVRDAKVKLD